MRQALFTGFLLVISAGAICQQMPVRTVVSNDTTSEINGKALILPVTLIGLGFAEFNIDPIWQVNRDVQQALSSRVSRHVTLDNYTQYAPAVAVYALNLLGVKGKHTFLDRSVILGTALAGMGASVYGLKMLTHIQRPDGSTWNAFPSGHTAMAFACAEFLNQEYRDVSPWIGVAGYAVAAGTGFLRMYNNRHWLTDVVAGAGFGILSTKVAYWVFPKIRQWYHDKLGFTVTWVPPPMPLRPAPR